MKLLDNVKLINDRDEYKIENIEKGMIGTIIDAEIRFNEFYVVFPDQRIYDKNFIWNEENMMSAKTDVTLGIKIQDLELIKDNNTTDEYIYENLIKKSKNIWCKVEDGFIMNLLGDKKNKIPYDYDS